MRKALLDSQGDVTTARKLIANANIAQSKKSQITLFIVGTILSLITISTAAMQFSIMGPNPPVGSGDIVLFTIYFPVAVGVTGFVYLIRFITSKVKTLTPFIITMALSIISIWLYFVSLG